MADDDTSQTPLDFVSIATQLAIGAAPDLSANAVSDALSTANLKKTVGALRFFGTFTTELGTWLGETLAKLEEVMAPVLAGFTAPMVAGMLGGDVDVSAFADKANSGARNAATRALIDAFFAQLAGDSADIAQPSDEGAKRVAAAGLHAAVEGWFLGALGEVASDVFPEGVGHFTALTRLPDEVIAALGIGRLVRTALRPLVAATAATPLTWAVEKTYRTKLLAESTAIRQFLRGQWDWTDVEEELARQGYTSERIAALLNELSKFFGPADVRELVYRGTWTNDQGLQHLRDQGYDESTALIALRLEGVKRIAQQENELAAAAVDAFVRGGIDAAGLDAFLNASIGVDAERALHVELAQAKRSLKAKPLTPAEAEACVLAEVLAVPDYRAALDRDGYTPDAADALELLLRKKLDAKASAADLRKEQAADKAAAAAKKAATAAAKQAAIDQARALKAQGSIAELEHAVIVGLIPIARLEQVLSQEFDGDTVGIYVADVEQKRAAYVAQQQQRADAAKRAANKGLPTANYETAVVDGVLTMSQFRDACAAHGIAQADIDLLVATLTTRKADRDAAVAKRAAAVKTAATKHIDLARFESLVLLGDRTVADYDRLLASLNFDDASRAAMDQLLQAKAAVHAAGTSIRAAAKKATPAKGLTLDQHRRAVILGEETINAFQTFLVSAGYTSDAQAVLVDELRADVAAADAARQRRSQGDTTAAASVVKLPTVAKAAQLGVISPAVYQQRLQAAGYTADDVALEMNLLQAEMAKAAQTKKTIAAPPTPAPPPASTLQQTFTAAAAGSATIDQVRAAAVTAGLDAAQVADVVALLQAQLDATAAGGIP